MSRGVECELEQGLIGELQRFTTAGLDTAVRYVRLRVHDNHGDKSIVGLGRVVFLA